MIVERVNVLVMKILNTEDFIKTYVKTKVKESDTTNIYSVCNIHGLFENIIKYLNVKSILNLKESCLIKQLTIQNNGDINFISSIERLIENPRRLYDLYAEYGRYAFGRYVFYQACKNGNLESVKLFFTLHPFHKYKINSVGSEMTMKQIVAYIYYDGFTPLMAAAKNEHFQIVQYLLEQGEADPNIARGDGKNALHLAARNNRKSTELIELLLTHMSLDSINKKNRWGYTPLDRAYHNRSPIQQEIIALLRSKGGKANYFDKNGRTVGRCNGDLNH